MPIQFSLIKTTDDQFITVFVPGRDPLPANSGHPNFGSIVALCVESAQGADIDADEVADLFDIGATVERKFERLSERITVVNGVVCKDGDPVEDGLTKQILRFMDEGEDFEPLVNFMEKIASNPNDHSRTQAWDWLNQHDFTLTEDGDVVGYKGVYSDDNGGYRSGHRGNAIRNGDQITGDYVTNDVGDVIEMPRSEVAHDPREACKQGLHVGTYDYAQSYARGAMLRVIVNPRDIVSVPTDGAGAKIRVCRYKVEAIIDAPDTGALYRSSGVSFYDVDDDSCDLDLSL